MVKSRAPRRMRRSIPTAPMADDWMPVCQALLLKLADSLPPSEEIACAAVSTARDEWIERIAAETLEEARPEDHCERWYDSIQVLLQKAREQDSGNIGALRGRLYDLVHRAEWEYGLVITELVCGRIVEAAGDFSVVPIPPVAEELADVLGLSEDEVRVPVVLYALNDQDEATRAVRQQSERKAVQVVAGLCGLSVSEFVRLTGASGRLSQLGLLQQTRTRDEVLDIRLAASLLFSFRSQTLEDLSAGLFAEPRTSGYSPADFPLSRGEASTIARLVAAGNSVLITGEPGVGKTEFAFALGATLGKTVRSLSVDPLGDSRASRRDSSDRVVMARIAAALLDRTCDILLIDEADAMLQSATGAFGFFGFGSGSYDKAELNALLDDLSVPAIWITNEIRGVPRSALRRFAHVCEFPRPTATVRTRMLQQRLADAGMSLSASFVRRLAAGYDLTPGAIDRIVAVLDAERSADGEDTPGAPPNLERRATEYLDAASNGPLARDFRRVPGPPERFDPRFCATSTSLTDIQTQAKRTVEAGRPYKLLFEGPPGGGKTHYALYLAQQLDLEAQVVRPSDLVSPYVGQTEQNIARLFDQAQNSPCVLILDEADALLGDRAGSTKSYELRWASEFLTSLQEFRGTLVACTNRVEAIDQAIRRRFHRRIFFGPLPEELLLPALSHIFPRVRFGKADSRALLQAPNVMMSDLATARELWELAGDAPRAEGPADGTTDVSETTADPAVRRREGAQIIQDILNSAGSREMSHSIGF